MVEEVKDEDFATLNRPTSGQIVSVLKTMSVSSHTGFEGFVFKNKLGIDLKVMVADTSVDMMKASIMDGLLGGTGTLETIPEDEELDPNDPKIHFKQLRRIMIQKRRERSVDQQIERISVIPKNQQIYRKTQELMYLSK